MEKLMALYRWALPIRTVKERSEPARPEPTIYIDTIASLKKEPNPLLLEVFSSRNVDNLLRRVRASFYAETGKVVDVEAQSRPDVLAILRASYVSNSGGPLKVINDSAFNFMMRQVRSNASARVAYLKQLDASLKPMDYPKSSNVSGKKIVKADPGLI